MILVGTTTEVVPVVRIDERPIGARTAGPDGAAGSWDAYRHDEIERWLAGPVPRNRLIRASSVDTPPGARMTTSEASDDPFVRHFRRDPSARRRDPDHPADRPAG